MKPTGSGLLFRDQECAEQAYDNARWEHRQFIRELEALNERLDSLALDKLIQNQKERLSK